MHPVPVTLTALPIPLPPSQPRRTPCALRNQNAMLGRMCRVTMRDKVLTIELETKLEIIEVFRALRHGESHGSGGYESWL